MYKFYIISRNIAMIIIYKIFININLYLQPRDVVAKRSVEIIPSVSVSTPVAPGQSFATPATVQEPLRGLSLKQGFVCLTFH